MATTSNAAMRKKTPFYASIFLRRDTKAMRYAVVIEQSNNRFCATVPDLPGFLKTGTSIDEIEANIHEAIVHHLDALCEEGRQIPAPTAVVEYCELAA